MNEVGERLKTARKAQRLTQAQLGERVGVTQSAIANIEGGLNPPSLDTLRTICSVLGVSADLVLFGSGEETAA